jgi:hypothetical protein
MLAVMGLTSMPVERGELKTGFQGAFNTGVHPDRPGHQHAAAVSAISTSAVHEPREPWRRLILTLVFTASLRPSLASQ